MSLYDNPFPEADADRHALWEMLVRRDIEAFLKQDWSLVADDFVTTGFRAIDAGRSDNPDTWKLTFATLDDYRRVWEDGAKEMNAAVEHERLRAGSYAATTLRDIEVRGDAAILHKKFDGEILANDGSRIPMHWQSIYQCDRVNGVWKIGGFVGYLPNPMGHFRRRGPQASGWSALDTGHAALSGPYTPVLTVKPGTLVVISGHAALDGDDQIIGTTIEAQARKTLENCAAQFAAAGCSLKDVFKVNVYLTDIANWEAFNVVYREVMPQPLPARTAVQAQLLPGLLVEIEMWAVRP